MSDNAITNVLNLLRLVKNTNMPGNAVVDHLRSWCGDDGAMQLRIAFYIIEQCDEACTLITLSTLDEEATAGLTQTARALKSAFLYTSFSNAMNNYLPQIDGSISSFAILNSVVSSGIAPSQDANLQELVVEVEKVSALFDEDGIDPLVKATAQRHLHVLLTLLRNVDALGLDAAMSAYSELVIRLRRAETTASADSREKTSTIWVTVKQWQDRFASIDAAVNTGASLLQHAQTIGHTLIGFLPQ